MSLDRSRLAVAGSAILLRAVAAVGLTRPPVGLHDPLLYQRFAQGIARGDGYVAFFGTPTSYYPPGYPLFLGAVHWVYDRFTDSPDGFPLTAALVQALLGGVTVWAVIGLGDRLVPVRPDAPWHRRLGLVAGVIVAVWPNLVLHSATLLSESLFLTLFCGFLLAVVAAARVTVDAGPVARIGRLTVAGALLGAAALVRPQVLLVVVAIAVLAASRTTWRERAVAVVVPMVAAGLVIAPWTIRNLTVFDEVVAVSTNGGDNLCVGFHPGATGHFEVPPECDTGEFYTDGPEAEVRRNDETGARALDWATSNLSALPALSARKLYYTYEHDHDALRAVESYEDDRFLGAGQRAAIRWSSDVFYAVVMLTAVAGAWVAVGRARRHRDELPVWGFVLTATAASALVPVLFFGETRFKVPATPLFAVLAGVALWTLAAEPTGEPMGEPMGEPTREPTDG